jgi:DNA processing protein
VSPARLRRLLDDHGPVDAWRRVRSGEAELGDAARRRAARTDVRALWRRHVEAGVGVCGRRSSSYPDVFDDDPDPPPVLFHRGDLDALSGARVAIVGTRRCTRYGRDVAVELGEGLAAAGVSVVSGLALGIDAAAHVGALRGGAPPVAVVGSGLDVVYPRANRALWEQVASSGVILAEAPLGAAPVAWRFPARNRLIAALADVVVVVESHERGGSLSTVSEAARRDRAVMAVPGPFRSPASAGTNRRGADGWAPVCGLDDVLVALGLPAGRHRAAHERRPPPDADGAVVLDALGWHAASLEQLAMRGGIDVGRLVVALERLRLAGWIEDRGGWFERIGRDRASASA